MRSGKDGRRLRRNRQPFESGECVRFRDGLGQPPGRSIGEMSALATDSDTVTVTVTGIPHSTRSGEHTLGYSQRMSQRSQRRRSRQTC